MAPQRGTRVQVRTAYDEVITMVALAAPKAGRDFPVLWVCTEAEYEGSADPEAIAWPLDAVLTLEPA